MALSYSINATAVTPAVAPAINPAVTSMLLLVTSNALKMVKTRRQNAKADANPSLTKFSKKHNDLKIKQVQEYSRHAGGMYPLNLYALGLNYSSTEAEMKSLLFHGA